MRKAIQKYIIYGQLFFIGSLLICVALLPKGLSANDGFSFYGTHKQTVVFSTIGLAGLGWSYFKASRLFPAVPEALPITVSVYVILASLFAGIVTPFGAGPGFHWAHVAATIVIFSSQFGLAIWLAVNKFRLPKLMLLGLLAAEALVTLISLHPTQGFLMQGETAFQATFAALFALGVPDILEDTADRAVTAG